MIDKSDWMLFFNYNVASVSTATQTVCMVSLSSSVYCAVFVAFNENQYKFSHESFLILAQKKKSRKWREWEKQTNKRLYSHTFFFPLKNRCPFL